LTCALTGLLISPVSWSHHWVWTAPALVVATDLARRVPAPGAPPRQPEQGTERPARRRRRTHWRQWAAWCGVAALAAPFCTLPEVLVPASIVQGKGADGLQLLIGDLYVIAGLAALCLVGLILTTHERRPAQLRLYLRRRGVGIAGSADRWMRLTRPSDRAAQPAAGDRPNWPCSPLAGLAIAVTQRPSPSRVPVRGKELLTGAVSG